MSGAVTSLFVREMRRFARQPSRVVASVGTPALVWLFLSSGFADSMSVGDVEGGYAEFAVPGIATMVVLFSTIFASISLIQDRQAGLLQAVIVSPSSSFAVATSKALAGSVLATAQAGLVLLAAFAVGDPAGITGFGLALLACFAASIGLTCLGLALAWWVNSTSGFHGVMNLVLMPLWLLSGAVFPVEGASGWLGVVVRLNPVHHANEAVADGLAGAVDPLHWAVTLGFAVLSYVGVLRVVRTTPSGLSQRAIA